eukprot:TRINITY_DN33166_c0_g1_i1.p1 TRINITY_DN33166_c0_g1~~TRINITY_DN33166_c0_g1_i1.p1  ORF type:complete len:532 (+),score=61.66 TRINITY_DN33166_c0_g1_i1:237-1598(+)
MYNLVNKVVDIINNAHDLKAISKLQLSRNVLMDLENLRLIHDLLVEKLQVNSTAYFTNDVSAIPEVFTFERSTPLGVNFEVANDHTCVTHLKEVVNDLRSTLMNLERTSHAWLESLSQIVDVQIGDLEHVYEYGLGCDGVNEKAEVLDGFYERAAGVGGHCRDLPGLSAQEARAVCVNKCIALGDCAGFTWLDGENDTDIDGSRCCFRKNIFHRYAQDDTACFVTSRLRLISLDSEGVLDWLDIHGFSDLTPANGAFAINGLVLSSLTRPKLREYLVKRDTTLMSEAEASILKCTIDAYVTGVESSRCGQPSLKAQYERLVGVVDPYIFFGIKSGNGRFTSTNWILGAAKRIVDWSGDHARADPTYKNAAKHVARMLGRYLSIRFMVDHLNTLGDQMLLAGSLDPVAIASSATYILNEALTLPWDDCAAIHKQLMQTNLWSRVNAQMQRNVGA